MNSKTNKLYRLSVCMLVTGLISVLLLCGCGRKQSAGYYSQSGSSTHADKDLISGNSEHDLSGEYAYNDGESYHAAIKFASDGECTVYQDSYSNAWPATYYWSTSSSSYHVKGEASENNLAFSFEFVVDGDRLIVIEGNYKDAVFKKGTLEEFIVNVPKDTLPKHNAEVDVDAVIGTVEGNSNDPDVHVDDIINSVMNDEN